MLRLGSICLILLWISVQTLSSQENVGPWYFSYNKDNGSLVAYNLTGASKILIKKGVTGFNVIGTRINSNEALLLLRVDEVFGLYHATPNQITLLVGEDGILQFPLAATNGAAVMINQYAGQPVYASLFKNGTLTRLPNQVFGAPSYARFSQDGQFFRYIGPDENGSLMLWNYDTTANTSSPVFDFGTAVPALKVDTYGDHWIQRTALSDGRASYRVIDMTGQVEEIGTADESQSSGAFQILGNEVITYPATCESTCSFEISSAEGLQTFQVDTSTFRSLPVARLGTDRLLMLNQGNQFYTVSPDAPPQLVGSFTRQKNHLFNASFLAVSPDKRWLMTVDDVKAPTKHHIHDLLTGEIIATYNYAKAPYLEKVEYGEGVVSLRFNDASYDFLVYQPDGTYEIVHQPREKNIRIYFEFLPDQTALYRTADPYTGIYRHDLKAGTETPVLEGAWDLINMMKLR